jgi:hypothetical protein
MNGFTTSENLISYIREGRLLALTAPFLTDKNVLIGYAVSSDECYCVTAIFQSLPQQIEADLIKTAMVRLDRILRGRNMKARIVMMIHESIWVEAPHGDDEEVRRLVSNMMSTAGRLAVPLEVDTE